MGGVTAGFGEDPEQRHPDHPALLVVGVSHRTAPLPVRERLAIPSRELPDALAILHRDPLLPEVAVLSTCNRLELYAVTPDATAALENLHSFLCFRSRLAPGHLRRALYVRTGEDAARQLFRVAAGLDSMILGETEITSQVKQAYDAARAAGTVGPVLHRLFQKSFRCAKLIRSTTHVNRGQASVGSVVVALARRVLGEPLDQREALLWGAGKAAEVTGRHLVKAGIGRLWVVNRTEAKAEELAQLCSGGWVSWERAREHLAHVDIAIVCTQAPHHVIDEGDVLSILPQRGNRALLIVDLAVPRNVDPAIRTLPGVQLYNIDDLQGIVQANVAVRKRELSWCEEIIQEQVDHLLRWQGVYRKQRKEGQDALDQGLVASGAGW